MTGDRVKIVAGRLRARRLGLPGARVDRGVRVFRKPGARLDVGVGVRIFDGVRLHLDSPDALLRIGEGTYLNRGTVIAVRSSVSIGRDCAVAWGVNILDSDYHQLDDAPATSPVVIEDRVWIGCGATILKGVTVGEGSVVAAGAVLTRDVPPKSLVAGNPARVIREGVTWA